MYMDRVGTSADGEVRSDLANARTLITGLTAETGVDVARAFADLNARLVVHTTDLSPEIIELVAVLSQGASEIRLHTHDITGAEEAATFAQTSAQAYGGLDVAINMASISEAEIDDIAGDSDLEALVASKLSPLSQLTRVVANRMRLVMSEGLILNVFKMPEPRSSRVSAVAAFARTALAALTAKEARAWMDHGIRVNSVGPRVWVAGGDRGGACLTNEPDVATLALYLASARGRTLSGHVFDAEGLGC